MRVSFGDGEPGPGAKIVVSGLIERTYSIPLASSSERSCVFSPYAIPSTGARSIAQPAACRPPDPERGLVWKATCSGIFAFRRRPGSSHQSSGRYSATPTAASHAHHRVQRHPDLAVTDLPQRPGILALDPRQVLAVLREPGVIKHPRLRVNDRRDALGHGLHQPPRTPRTIGQDCCRL